MGQSRSIFMAFVGVSLWAMPIAALAQTTPADQNIYGDTTLLRGAVTAGDFADKKPAQTAAKRLKVDPYTITGYDDGVFSLKPSLELSAVASDNSNFTAAGRQSGFGYVVKPSLNFATAWPVHQWTGTVAGNWTSFPTDSAIDGLAGTAQTNFRLDIRRSLWVNLEANAVVSESMAGQTQVPGNATSARRDWTVGSSVGVTNDFGSFQSSAKFGILRAAFGDVPLSTGAIISNSAFNYIEPSLSLRGSFEHRHAAFKPYVEIAYVPRLHDVNGDQRNSQGATAALGVTLDDGPIWQGDFAAVVMARQYSASQLGVALNGGVNGNLTWSPTPNWSVVATSTVSLNETTLPGVGALPSWMFGINATYAVRENLFLRTGVAVTLASNGNGMDQTTAANAGADYMFTRHIGMTGTVQSTWINSSNSSSRDEQRVMLGVLLKP